MFRLATRLESNLSDFISRMAKKYIDRDRYPWHQEGDGRVIMKLAPTKTSGMG